MSYFPLEYRLLIASSNFFIFWKWKLCKGNPILYLISGKMQRELLKKHFMRKRIWIHRCMYSRKTIILLLLMKSIRNFWQKYWQIQRCGRCSIHWRRRWSNKFYIQINIFIVHMENISPSNPLKSPSFSIKIMEINSKWRRFQWEILIILQILRSCFNSKYGSI